MWCDPPSNLFRACYCLYHFNHTSPWFIYPSSSRRKTYLICTPKDAHINRWLCLLELHQKLYFVLVLIKQCYPQRYLETSINLAHDQTVRKSLNLMILLVQRQSEGNESAIPLNDTNTVMATKNPHFQSEFITIWSEIQVEPQDQSRKLHSSIFSNSSLI